MKKIMILGESCQCQHKEVAHAWQTKKGVWWQGSTDFHRCFWIALNVPFLKVSHFSQGVLLKFWLRSDQLSVVPVARQLASQWQSEAPKTSLTCWEDQLCDSVWLWWARYQCTNKQMSTSGLLWVCYLPSKVQMADNITKTPNIISWNYWENS